MSQKTPTPTPQEIANQFNNMKQELNAIAQKLGELDMEKDEHQLVVETLEPLNPSRKCYRLVGGVLVERTVKDVLPAVQTNMDGVSIINIVNQLVQNYKKKEDELESYKKKYNIQVKAN
ncbi:hypothetical protein HK096_004136 [Nowakowskiella sp. JEL0078]|nr:hypothetical protein HK096_004136 [Nowakowskiella sp. JEL0078]